MTPQAHFCVICGGPLETREVEGRQRQVCTACGNVFYQNPLPVAAALVLNERRELLLVRRRQEPQKGEWCLPIGFAELGETIAEATLRELREEAGIEGRILGLLDSDSYQSDFYGDLLIVTFEVEKTGGAERAGDDAEDVRYFPLDRVPPLAFAANTKALETCIQRRSDEWAIQDSFRALRRESLGDLLSDSLVQFVEEHAEQIARFWLDDVRSNHTTGAYADLNEEALQERAEATILLFTRWLRRRDEDQEVRRFHRAAGGERRADGVPLHQVLSALALLRKQIWVFALTHGVWEKPIDVYRVLELDRRIMVFFDRAMVQLARGYEDPPAE